LLKAPRHADLGRAASFLIGLLTAAILAAGCATSSAIRRGQAAEQRQDYDSAVVEYSAALKRRPDDTNARLALDRAKLRAASDHFQRGRRFAATGRFEQALVEYELALELNPASTETDGALRSVRDELRAKNAAARLGKTDLQAVIERARDLPAPGLDLPAEPSMPASLVFREASSRLVFQSIAKLADISLGFDPAFREANVTIDLRNTTLPQALVAVADSTRTFLRVTAPRTVLVIPDTPAKRREYEEEVVRTFYLSNADLKETIDVLRMVLDARRISPTSANNALTIKDTPERIEAAERVLAAIDKARPEVVIDVELLEVDRTKLLEYGLQIASPGTPPVGLDGSVSIATEPNGTITLDALRNLSSSDVIFANLPSLYYRLLKADTNTRALANPQLRTMEGMVARARFGQRVPVPVTTFAPIATGGTPQQPIVSYNYENIGVNIDITPRMHHDDDVTLAIAVTVQTISGAGFGGLPTFANREINTQIRLKSGETNMLAGLIRDDERRVVNGIPGLSDLPIIGRIFGHTRNETTQSDIILTLTPHIVRVLDLNESDLQAFRVRRDSQTPLAELPPLDVPRPLDVPKPAPGAAGAPAPADQPAQPIQPPPPAAPVPPPPPR
jgi:general secretion pathway protein D